MKIITNSESETLALAKRLAARSRAGEVYALSGDLGAGKTVFARGFAAGLGVRRNVNSPTFVLMKIYPVKNRKTIRHLCHIDAYRLKSLKDLEAIGARDYFNADDSVCLVEWPENIGKILPKNAVLIKIKHLREHKREINIKNQP